MPPARLPRSPLTPTRRHPRAPSRSASSGATPRRPAASLRGGGRSGRAASPLGSFLPGFFPLHSAHSSVRSPSARSQRTSCASRARRTPPASSWHSPQPHDMADTSPPPSFPFSSCCAPYEVPRQARATSSSPPSRHGVVMRVPPVTVW